MDNPELTDDDIKELDSKFLIGFLERVHRLRPYEYQVAQMPPSMRKFYDPEAKRQ